MEDRTVRSGEPRRPPLSRRPDLPASAPLEAQAMAQLVRWSFDPDPQERLLDSFVQIAGLACQWERPLVLLPELQALVDLQAGLPAALQASGVQPTVTAAAAGGQLVDFTVKALTPVLESTLSFEDALKIADHPQRWSSATPQMQCLAQAPLPANGSLWRHSLTKRTDFGTPLVGGLVTEETIHITAEGSTSADGKSGHRRYTHVLFSSNSTAPLVPVVKDTGWIELSGDEDGIQLRIQKEATVRRPAGDPYAAILSAGFSAELWLWAMGFFSAGGVAHKPPPASAARPMPQRDKAVAAAAAGSTRVAVLGGGPAGLACAWLLSRPADPKNPQAFAWDPPAAGLDLKVILVEECCIPGGKAASARRIDQGEQFRVEEHGLHVLMGCYANVLELMRWTQSDSELVEFGRTHLPATAGGGLGDLWTVEAGPWPAPQKITSLQQWVEEQQVDLQQFEPFVNIGVEREEARTALFRLGEASLQPRPLLRAFTAIAQPIRTRSATVGAFPKSAQQLHHVLLHWMAARVAKTVVLHTAYLMSGNPQAAKAAGIGDLARLMRSFARAGLVPDPSDPEIGHVREWVELAATITIGLDDAGLFPAWAIDDPSKLLDPLYPQWALALQSLDGKSLQDWLEQYDIEQGFVASSRILASLTAALFTTPAGIAAGTFIHGMARLLLTYQGKPYRRMKGGTGEAFVAPIIQRLTAANAEVRLGTSVADVQLDANGKVASAQVVQHKQPVAGEFATHGNGTRMGWGVPSQAATVNTPGTIAADAFVLAIPPYAAMLPGLPAALRADLAKIGHRATIGVQSWSQGQPNFPDAIVSPMPGPLRCAAHMSDLGEGATFGVPLYACGDVDDTEALKWKADDTPLGDWLANFRPLLQPGAVAAHAPFKKVNDTGSERYTCADTATQAARRFGYDTGVPNLWLAGDWTRTAFSCGSIEGAVTSGLEAARDILEALDCTVHFPIVGAIPQEQP